MVPLPLWAGGSSVLVSRGDCAKALVSRAKPRGLEESGTEKGQAPGSRLRSGLRTVQPPGGQVGAYPIPVPAQGPGEKDRL